MTECNTLNTVDTDDSLEIGEYANFVDQQDEEILLSLLPKNESIRAIVLSYWHNILGPKNLMIWTQDNEETDAWDDEFYLSAKILKYISSHSMKGVLELKEGFVKEKLMVVEELDCVIFSLVFAIAESDVNHCLSMIAPRNKLQSILDMNQLCTQATYQFVKLFKAYKSSLDRCTKMMTLHWKKFCYVFQALENDGLKSHSHYQGCFENLKKFSLPFLQSAIESHLLTLGYSVIVGHQATLVNALVCFLSKFAIDTKNSCCFASTSYLYSYMPGLHIQGLLKDNTGQIKIEVEDLLNHCHPQTVIDVDCEIVRQFDLSLNVSKNEKVILMKPKNEKHLFKNVKGSSSLIKSFVKNLTSGSSKISEIVFQFNHQLTYKAFALIKAFESLKQLKRGGQSATSSLDVLQKIIGMDTKNDFMIVLSVAETMRPGLFLAIKKDQPGDI